MTFYKDYKVYKSHKVLVPIGDFDSSKSSKPLINKPLLACEFVMARIVNLTWVFVLPWGR